MTLFGIVGGAILLVWWIGFVTRGEESGPFTRIHNKWEQP